MQQETTKLLPVKEIAVRSEFQIRLDKEPSLYVEDYSDGLAGAFPALDVFLIGDDPTYYLVDGWHRLQAALMTGLRMINCRILRGTMQDAVRYALKANSRHGLKRSRADKRNAVSIAIRNFRGLSNGAIAELCAVSDRFVDRIVSEIKTEDSARGIGESVTQEPPAEEKNTERIGRDGRAYTVKTPETKTVPVDATEIRYPIPAPALSAWERRTEVLELLNAVLRLKGQIISKRETNDVLWREVSFQALESALINAYDYIKRALPYAVCPACQGQLPENCTACWGRGMVSEFAWKSQAMEEARTIRAKAMKANPQL